MSQHFIRKLAGYGPIQRAIMKLHEPRIISGIYGAAYIIATIVGAITIFYPPKTLENIYGDIIMYFVAAALTIGGLIGVVTIAKGIYWIERYAVGAITTGLGFYLLLTGIITVTGSGYRQMTLFAIIFAIGFILMRSVWIFESPYRIVVGKTLPR